MSSYVPGLEGVIAAQTAISMVDGANGRLVYQGYVIADLAEDMSFEEVAFLLWKGRLPTRAELDALTLELAGSRALTQAATIALDALPKDTDPMDVLRSVVSVQGVEHKLEKPSIPLAIHATASFPTILPCSTAGSWDSSRSNREPISDTRRTTSTCSMAKSRARSWFMH